MKKFIIISAVALAAGLAGCNATAQADATVVATAICSAAATEASSGLALNSVETTAVNSVLAGCNATAQGTNLTSATAVAAIFAGLVTLQQGGLLTQIKMVALAPEEAQVRASGLLPKSTIDWIVKHDLR
jgi:uncharacterized lipoprotein NlpE involved in copper resistance